ncbi:MAG TPA: bifunctional serine/threonine-protein kinase/formylglycine-generating enzyme family protein [Anaerolineae bacterium]|nr:bifunctional serine/threonine-protein kinase/formylglycine-generating enzyme family protein [Anaerolineae bacterium]
MADLTGQRLGQYLILERISKGATSTVYKAYQEKLERYVAVKVLSPHFIDEEGFLERFKQEARAVAQLDHPNILSVYDFDQVGDVVYIVMKYVDTGTLKDLMGAPLDLRMALEIFTQVGLALGYAHRQGVIHRDVKPGNILLGEGNWALLTDYGLAKIRAGDRKLTKSGIGMGTPDYMSPEQAQGLPVDGRADLYSLGCTLHEMLTGRVPFEADSGMAVVVKHITEPPRPPREINPKLPLAVEQVILRSLEKNPGKRYQTAEAMVADLARAVGRGDQFVFATDLPALPATNVTRSVAPAARGIAIPQSSRLSQARDWLGEKQTVIAARARDTGVWTDVQLRRVGRGIRLGLQRFVEWLRHVATLIAARLQRGYASVRARFAERSAAQPPVATGKSAKATAARSRAPARKPRSTRAKKAAPASSPQTRIEVIGARVRSAIESVREWPIQRRDFLAIGLIILLLLLSTALVLNGVGGSGETGQPAETPIPGASPTLPVASTGGAVPTRGNGTPAPLATDTPPPPEPTALTLPAAPSGMVAVPGGTFKMGATGGSFDADETPPHWVTVNSFYIDAYEVTVAQYARFVGGSGWTTDAEKKGDATTWRTANTSDRQGFPVNRVSWNDADIYCRWYGKRLPTEAEWELAAKGYTENIYAWGGSFAAERTNTQAHGVGQPMAVGQLANASPFGAFDMIGNVWEWAYDRYGGDYYALSPAANPTGPDAGAEYVIRGGSFKSAGDRATTTIRRKASRDGWSDDIGFRCVKDIG